GLDLDKATERKVEGLFFREDFRRVYLEDVGRIDYANDVEQLYAKDYLSQLNIEAVRDGEGYSRIAVDYAHSSPSFILPALLGKLHADVVAINAVVQEQQLYQTPEQFEKAMERLGAITKTLQAGFGVRLDTAGERIYFVDEQGQQVTGMTALAVVCDLALSQANEDAKSQAQNEDSVDGDSTNPKPKTQNPKSIVVPVYAPSIFEEIAKKHGAEIVRTRFNSYALMSAALKQGVVVAGDGQGSFIFPPFQPTADGLFAIAKLMELTALSKTRFTQAIENLPRYAMASTRVPCRWEDKGRVMRILNEQYRDNTAKQVDGVKINLGNGEWALILPDADRPLFHVIAEADTDAEARQLVDKYSGLVQGLQ
ncbi:MAG: nucleotidyl transferase, partial [Chloroflexia bacterium]